MTFMDDKYLNNYEFNQISFGPDSNYNLVYI
jgi:hypothetical protein